MINTSREQLELGSTPRGEQIFSALITGLREGRYLPGRRIRDKDIAEEFGVSRTPARDAIGRLCSRGLLEMTPGGLTVRTLSPPEVLELYTVRQILEGSAARFAAQHASRAEILALADLMSSFFEQAGNPKIQAKLNRQFHAGIREAAHNRFLTKTLDELDVALCLLPGTTYDIADRAAQAYREHIEILNGIETRDADAAEAAAKRHIQQAQQARLSDRRFKLS